MREKFYTSEERKRAKALVAAGKTYREVRLILGVPKSTLSTWFSGVVKKPRTREELLVHLASVRPKALKTLQDKARLRHEQEDKLVHKDVIQLVKQIPVNQTSIKKLILAMLYWAEGAKHEKVFGLKFVNTDPKLLQLYTKLLRASYSINEKRLSVRLHLHYYHSKKEATSFWSKILNIPPGQFNKPHFKKRSKTKKFRKNFAGICTIYYGSNFIRKELLGLAYSLQKAIIH